MNNYKLQKIENNVGVFKDSKTGTIVQIPYRTWTEMQKFCMKEFLNPSGKRKFKHEGTC